MQESSGTELANDRTATPKIGGLGLRVSVQVYQSGGAGEFSARPPPGETRSDWLARLKKALGSRSGAFVDGCLHRLLTACTLPGQPVPTSTSVSAALALVESLEPQNEIEAAIAVDIACLHSAVSNMHRRLAGQSILSNLSSAASAVAKLERAFHSSVALYHRLKHGNRQTIRIERVVIEAGAQAIVGQIAGG